MTPYLFVYGTLMSSAQSAMGFEPRRRLAIEATSLGPASTAGRLFNLGAYPGLVHADRAGQVVFGEALKLRHPATTLTWLDRYEGIPPGALPGTGLYVRERRPTTTSRSRTIDAWVYILTRQPPAFRLIESGRWNED